MGFKTFFVFLNTKFTKIRFLKKCPSVCQLKMIYFTVKCFMNEKENHICDDICDFLSSISYLVVQTQHLYNLCLTQQTAFISTVLTHSCCKCSSTLQYTDTAAATEAQWPVTEPCVPSVKAEEKKKPTSPHYQYSSRSCCEFHLDTVVIVSVDTEIFISF